MPIDKEELKKLSPEDRLKKLKELEQESKKEIDEAEDLIKRTEAEIEHNKNIPNIEVPKIEPVDISRMFEAPEGLESTIKKEAPEEAESKIKYNPSNDYSDSAESLWQPPEATLHEKPIKTEDTLKYESAQDQADELTASRSVLKNIKKYTRG